MQLWVGISSKSDTGLGGVFCLDLNQVPTNTGYHIGASISSYLPHFIVMHFGQEILT